MKNAHNITAINTAPKGIAGHCPACGAALYNPGKEEHLGLSLTLRWEIECPVCGGKVTVENPRFSGLRLVYKGGRK